MDTELPGSQSSPRIVRSPLAPPAPSGSKTMDAARAPARPPGRIRATASAASSPPLG